MAAGFLTFVDNITNFRYIEIMNENIISIFQKSNISQYALSDRSGVPYSTINGLLLCNHAVNKCSASVLFRIAKALDTELERLLDPYEVMKGIKDNYKGYTYKWEYVDKCVFVTIKEETGQSVRLEIDNPCNLPYKIEEYKDLAKSRIDKYIAQKEIWRNETKAVTGRNTFGMFRSNVQHSIRSDEVKFIETLTANNDIEEYFNNGEYTKALYLLCCLETLCEKNSLPLDTKFSKYDGIALKNPLYIYETGDFLPAFKERNIYERSLYNVY